MPAILTALALLVALEARPAVTLVLCDIPGALRDSGGNTLRAEVSTLLAATGLAIRWREIAPGGSFESSEIPVILLPSELRNHDGERVLGAVIGRHRFPSPIWISAPNVRWVLGAHDADAGGARRVAVERALGRVIAHEVVHVFAPEHPHTALGLMGRTVNKRLLTREAGALDQDCLSAVARALHSPELRSQVSGPPLVALTGS